MAMTSHLSAASSPYSGYAKEEVIGISIDNYVPNSSRAPLRAAIKKAILGEEVEGVELSIIKVSRDELTDKV